jgi:general stress protein CsbA
MTSQTGVSTVAIDRSPSRPQTWLLPLFAILVLVYAITLSVPNLLSIGFIFERNYNEGWNVYNAQRLIGHELIYDSNYWRINNYPIFSFLLAVGVNFIIHNLLISGRVIALVSFVAVGILAAAAIRRFGGDRVDAVFGGGCALGFCYLVAPGWIAVDDPQTLAQALMLGGLVSYLSRSHDRLSLLRTAVLVTLGGFVKHNIVAIPLAITLDIAIRSPRRLLFWLGCCAGLAVSCVGVTQLVAGGAFVDHLLLPRLFTWYGARYHLMKYLRLGEFPFAVILLFARVIFSRERYILAVYGTISICAATIFAGFEGTSYNMFQDAAVFLAIAAGVLLHELRSRLSAVASPSARGAKFALSIAPLLLAQPILARSPAAFAQIYHAGGLLEIDRQAERSFLAEAEFVSGKHGPAICESLLLCYRAGQPFVLDPFNSRQLILAGRLDQNELIQRIAAQEFAVVQLRADICDDPASESCQIMHYRRKIYRFTDEVLYAIDRYYRIAWRSQDGTFYVPK